MAAIATDDTEDLEMLILVGDVLLDFPRERHRPLLQRLATKHRGFPALFSIADVNAALARATDVPVPAPGDPWKFYDSAEIAQRQRWRESGDDEDADDEDDDTEMDFAPPFAEPALPYLREAPKVGRNDPCPCGSGKKYKKCCLEADR
jgi:hypothetical protein